MMINISKYVMTACLYLHHDLIFIVNLLYVIQCYINTAIVTAL